MAKGIVTAEEKQRAMVETVRGAVFPESSDAEMALFLTKCKLTGIDPLSKKIIPIAFNTKKGRNVSFITTIDLLRSKANETGKYEGMDETEFGELMDFEYTDYDGNKQTIEVPEYAKV